MSDIEHLSKAQQKAVRRNLWRRIFERVGSFWKFLAISVLCTMIASATQPALAYLMKPLLDEGFAGTRPDFVWLIPLAIIGLMFIRGVFNFFGEYLMAWVANKVLFRMRKEMFDSLLHMPDTEFQKGDSGRLLNRFTVDAGNVTQHAAEVVTNLVREVFVVLAMLALLLYLSWELTLIILVIFPFSVLVGGYFAKRLRTINRRTLDMNAVLTSTVKEGIEAQRVIKLFDGFERETTRFERVNQGLRAFAMRAATADAAMSPLTQWVISFSVAAVVSVALHQAERGLTPGDFIAFITALGQIFDPVRRLTNLASKSQKMMAAAESVFKLIDTPQERDEGTQICTVHADSLIEFQDITFQFNEESAEVLKHLSFRVKAGQTIALVGRSGSGKTTLVNMLPRFVEPSAGQIVIDGTPIHEFTLASLRHNLSLVSQHVVLFEGSIADNIRYGSNHAASDEQLRVVLEAANLWDFVQTLPEGLNTQIGESGSWLSGGQRQRLAIARALLKDAPILILDEATSALDNESEKLVQDSLERLMKGRTTFVIAHRLSTVKNADRILVLDGGVIIEDGSHEALLKNSGLYQSLYEMQFKEA
ncbi:lipid ABC transporter permease/ATP-binding protein [Oligella sp. HMSC05A10]|uniref:lipid A export permease/ATP-binding protein MsbA n=1 Tax=Oligella TaxID=90243 RepID=UPI0008A1865F|nr:MULTISPECIES: lipid A export permease/ATP-binding protein MsbA [Oligella]AVL70678.1 lipid A export permease/ATP-binding protein MsbA [Oligella urethralis]OFS82452.1 lipid ABC transporter permease/ATP-binding protein [Oligella sp. HMSC05A10]SUA59111.1 Lipid A export ATP-binding/permease protein MsbA [Oligella urethralis]